MIDKTHRVHCSEKSATFFPPKKKQPVWIMSQGKNRICSHKNVRNLVIIICSLLVQVGVNCVANTVDSWELEPRAVSNKNCFLLDFHHTFTVILPSVTQTLDNSNLPQLKVVFVFPSDHFDNYNFTLDIWALKKSGKKQSTGIQNIEFCISHWRVVGI